MVDETVTCKACGQETPALATFPGGICLKCYEQTPDARRPISANELTAMFSGKRSK